MSTPVNENQQIDLDRLKKWVEEGQELLPQVSELLSLAENTGFLEEIQAARENQIVDTMISEAFTPKDKDV